MNTTFSAGPRTAESASGRFGSLARSSATWIVALVLVLVAALVLVLTRAQPSETRPLHPDSTAADGGRAFMRVLSDHGVGTRSTEDLAEAQAAAADADTTLLVYDPDHVLAADTAQALSTTSGEAGNRLVVVDEFSAIESYTPDLHVAAVPDFADGTGGPSTLPPNCAWESATRAGTVTGTGMSYAIDPRLWNAPAAYDLCYSVTDANENGAVARVANGEGDLVALGSSAWLRNDSLADHGNAALVYNVLAAQGELVYYYPQAADQPGATTNDGAVSLLPEAFGPAIAWALVLGLLFLLVRGRRFGPLAVEDLPVTAPASETVAGRAALGMRSADRSGTLATLRTGALLRMSTTLGLPPEARTPEIVAAVASRTGRDPREVSAVLVEAVPATDAELVALATTLSTIESEVTRL